MAAVNIVILLGNVGKDPEVRCTPRGRAVAKFPLATTASWMDQEHGRQERTEWHQIVVWGRQAEHCAQYLAKGRQVYVEGAIHYRSYDDTDGNKRYVTEIFARRVQFLGSRGGNGSTSPRAEGGIDARPLAEAFATELGVPFCKVLYHRTIGETLRDTVSRPWRIFDSVRTRPWVLFFDEFETIAKERGDRTEELVFPPNYQPAALAELLRTPSWGELEEFATDIRWRCVLAGSGVDIAHIIEDRVHQYNTRFVSAY